MRTRLGTVLVLSLVCLAPRPAAAAHARVSALIGTGVPGFVLLANGFPGKP
jgi:hypothetical protein